MMRFFEKSNQSESLTQDVEQTIPESACLLIDEDLDRLQSIQSLEELDLAYSHFALYYGNELSQRQQTFRQSGRFDAAMKRRLRNARLQQRQKGQPMDVEGELDDHNLNLEDEKRHSVKSLAGAFIQLPDLVKSTTAYAKSIYGPTALPRTLISSVSNRTHGWAI